MTREQLPFFYDMMFGSVLCIEGITMTGLYSVGYFLLSSVFSLITFVLWARLFIRFFAVGTFHPFSQTIYKLTAKVIMPIQKNITRNQYVRGRYDLDCFILLVLCEILKFTIINLWFFKYSLSFIYVGIYVLADLIVQPCNILFYAIIIRTLMSWIYPFRQDAFSSLLFMVTEPLLRTVRRALPNTGLMDFSPIGAMIALKAVTILVSGLLPFPLV